MGVKIRGGLPADTEGNSNNGLAHVAEVLDGDSSRDVYAVVRFHASASERNNDSGVFTHKLSIGAIEGFVDGQHADAARRLLEEAHTKRTGEATLDGWDDAASGTSTGDPAETARQAEAVRFEGGEGAPIVPPPQPGVIAGQAGEDGVDPSPAPDAETTPPPDDLTSRRSSRRSTRKPRGTAAK